jgi:hypothetical protein
LDEDSVPNTHVNVPPLLSITPPEEHPGSADVGIPDPRYAWNISAHPFVPDSDVVHAELSGIQTKHPAVDPVYEILNSDTLDLISSIWKYCVPDLPEE